MLTFPFDTEQSTQGQVFFRSVFTDFGDGYSQRSPDGINNKIDSWTIKVPWLNSTQVTTMETFLDSVGFHDAFLWKPPNSPTQNKYIITNLSIESENSKIAYSLSIKRVYDIV